MEEFTQLFGNLLAFVYHCFDRMVIHGYLSGLSRPEQVVYFLRQVLSKMKFSFRDTHGCSQSSDLATSPRRLL